jgi:O-antigen/teichoic acid export membrane protein
MDEKIEDMVKTTTRGSLMILAGQIASTIVLAIGMLFVAKLLGPSNYGSFNKAQSVVQIAFLVMNLGISSAMTKFLAQYRHENKPGTLKVLVETGLILNIMVSILLTVIVYNISGYVANNVFNEPEQQLYIRYLSISIIGQAIMTYSFGVTVGYERMGLRSIQRVSYSFLKSIISPILVFIGYGTLGAIIGHTSPILLSGLLGLVFIWLIYRQQSDAEPDITHVEAARMILSYGFPLYLTVLLSGSLPHLYTTLLGMWVPNESIGNYSVTLNFSVLMSFVTIPIGTAIFPLFSNWRKTVMS